MKRREFITLLGGAAAWPAVARAQQPAKLPTIGSIGAGTLSSGREATAAFVQRLRELGWNEGRNVAFVYRWTEGSNDRAAEVATEFVRLRVDVIVAEGTPTTAAAKQATSVIPMGPGRHRLGCKSRTTRREHHRTIEPDQRRCR
jgi:putative ABC transport system substrate-binding protein